MEYLPLQLFNFIKNRISQRNKRLLLSLIINLSILIIFNSSVFLLLISWEGQDYNFLDALYWTFTIFTTLGLGDIVFKSTIGHVFTIWVLLSGITAFFIMTPYVFFQFFQSEARAPRSLRSWISGHVIIIGYNQITKTLINYLTHFKHTYSLLVDDLEQGLHFHDNGLHVVVGDLHDSDTFENMRIKKSALIVTCGSDKLNANVALTVREICTNVPIVATASSTSEEILKTAGCTHIITPDVIIGKSLARRILAGDAIAHIIGTFDEFVIAESSATNTPMVGKTLKECRIREISGVNVIGVWERGGYLPAGPHTKIGKNSILVLAGTKQQVNDYNTLFCIYNVSEAHVIIIGSGNVSKAVVAELQTRHISYKIINLKQESYPAESGQINREIISDLELEEAGTSEASAVIITSDDDDLNIYLTLYLRRLRPDMHIISRSIAEKNVSTLYHAGADFVLSYAAVGASAIMNILRGGDLLILTEGLNILRLPTPLKLAGKMIAESDVRAKTDCSIVAVQVDQKFIVNPDPDVRLPEKGDIYIIGNAEAERKFYSIYG
jgi:voltage-gated potassium channel